MMRFVILIAAASVLTRVLSGCNNAPGYPKPGAEVVRPQDQLSFNTLYQQNCAACHGTDGQNGAAVDLANPEYQALVDDRSLRRWISKGMSGTQMPAFAISAGGTLTEQQIDAIVRGIRRRWLRQGVLGGLNPPPYMQDQSGDARHGQQAYNTNCASCHQGSKQQVTSHDYLALVSDQALRTIVIAGRPDIGHPDWRNDKPGYPLSAQEVTDIVSYLATLRSATPGQPYPQHP
jgi:cytochrome c oxidase cbb3-type subunit III